MPSNELARWIAGLMQNATAWEIVAALVGIAASGYALWGAIDNVLDLRNVRRERIQHDPRWITALCLLGANVFFLVSWLGYTHVAMLAVYLPSRQDVASATLNEAAVMRLLYALCGLFAQAILREMRTRLRGLTREQWAPVYGEAQKMAALYHASQADLRRAQAEAATHRAEKHDALAREGALSGYVQILQRVLRRNGIEVPLVETFPSEGAP